MDALNACMARHFGRFNVFQLLRLIARQAGGQPGGQAAVRFRADLAAAFPGREFSGIEADADGSVLRIATPNYCVAGILGPLPETYTQWLREQCGRGQFATRDFLDIYNHRLNTLRFGIKAALLPELSDAAPEACAHAQRLDALMGFGLPQLVQQIELPARTRLALCALLADGRRSAAAAARALWLVYGGTVRIEQLVGAWRPIEPSDRGVLSPGALRLGRTSVLGRRVWDPQARVRITFGGWDYARACSVLPRERGRAPVRGYLHLRSLVWLLLDRQFDCEIRIDIDRGVPSSALASTPDRSRRWGLRLGQTAWLSRADFAAGDAASPAHASFVIHANPPESTP